MILVPVLQCTCGKRALKTNLDPKFVVLVLVWDLKGGIGSRIDYFFQKKGSKK